MSSESPETRYTVAVLRSGQPRAYADTEREYLITVEREHYGREGFFPWMNGGDVEAVIKQEEAARADGNMFGGYPPDKLRTMQKDWAKSLVRALCQNFRERGDDDGKVGMEAHFFPTLKSLKIDPVAGTVRVLIIEPFTD